MDGLSTAASVIAVIQILGKVFDICRTYSRSVKDARKSIVRLQDEIASLELVLADIQKLEEAGEPGQLTTLIMLKKGQGPLIRCQRDLENLVGILEPEKQSMRKFGLRALKWPLESQEVDKSIQMIERYKSLFALALTGDHITLSLQIRQEIGKLDQQVKDANLATKSITSDTAAIKIDIAATHNAQTELEKERLQRKIIKWLWTTDPSVNFHAACKVHHPDTGQWLMNNPDFRNWKTTKGVLMWLHGIPGCGKTIMSSTIIRHLINQKSAKTTTAYFFFAFNDVTKQSPVICLSSLIAQICTNLSSIPNTLSDLYNYCGKGQRSPDLNELQRILSHLTTSSKLDDIFIVIDALDECPRTDTSNSRSALLKIISDLLQIPDMNAVQLAMDHAQQMTGHDGKWTIDDDQEASTSSNIHLLVTSRQEADIKTALSALPCMTEIAIQSQEVDKDIKRYVTTKVANDAELVSWSSDIKYQIEDTIAKGAHGMFRWAFCQLDALRKCKKKAALLRALRSLPKTLDDTYERILLAIDEDYRVEAHRALLWLSFSHRALSLFELAEAAVIDPEHQFDLDERFHNPGRDILDILGSLVTVSVNQDVRLSHYSVKEYLISNRIQTSRAAQFSACSMAPVLWFSKCCLRYIIDISRLSSGLEAIDTASCIAPKPRVDGLGLGGEGNGKQANCSRRDALDSDSSTPQSCSPASVEISTSVDLKMYPRLPLRANRDESGTEDEKPDDGVRFVYKSSTPSPRSLSGAMANSWKRTQPSTSQEIVSNLPPPLPKGWLAQFHQDSGRYYYIHFPTKTTQWEFPKYPTLVPQLYIPRGQWSTPKESLPPKLDTRSTLKTKPQTDLCANDSFPFLKYASTYWYNHASENVRLVEESLEPLLHEIYLSVAAYSTWSTIVGASWPPLYKASEQGFASVVKRLLAAGSDVLVTGQEKETALHAAARKGYASISSLILESPTSHKLLAAKDVHGRTALHVAALRGYQNIVSELIKAGSSLSDIDESGRTALHYACAGGCTHVAAQLLSMGCSINPVDHYKNTPLHVALSWNGSGSSIKASEEISLPQILFRFEADPRLRNWSGDTPLHVAVENGHGKEIVNMLLNHGADINAQGYNLRTALHIAVAMQFSRISLRHDVQMPNLNKVGELQDSKDQQRITDLLVHRDWGRKYGARAFWQPKIQWEVVNLLLERGADPWMRDHNHCAPRHVASLDGLAILDTWEISRREATKKREERNFAEKF